MTVSVAVGRNRGRNSYGPRGHVAPTGRAGFDIVPHRPSSKTQLPAQCHTGHSTGKPLGPVCSGSVAGRRRTGSVVRVLQSTTRQPRCPCDAGPLGRQGVTAPQKAGDEEPGNQGPTYQEERLSQQHSSVPRGTLRLARRHSFAQGDMSLCDAESPKTDQKAGADPQPHPAGETPAPQRGRNRARRPQPRPKQLRTSWTRRPNGTCGV